MGKILDALTHDVVRQAGPFATVAEASDAIKTRAAQLHLPYDAGAVTEAIATVARSRNVIACPECHRADAHILAFKRWPGGYNERIVCPSCGRIERSTRDRV